MSSRNCTYADCPLGILAKKIALEKIENPTPEQRLTPVEKDHILRSHSMTPVQLHNSFLGVGVVFKRKAENSMAFLCQCERIYWTRDGLTKHYKRHCSRINVLTQIKGMKLMDSTLISEDDMTMSLLTPSPDDEIGEDPHVRRSKTAAPLTEHLTRREFYDTMECTLIEQRRFQDQVMAAFAEMKSEMRISGRPASPDGPTSQSGPSLQAHLEPPQLGPPQIEPLQNDPAPTEQPQMDPLSLPQIQSPQNEAQFGPTQDNVQQIEPDDDPPLTRKRARVPVESPNPLPLPTRARDVPRFLRSASKQKQSQVQFPPTFITNNSQTFKN